MVNVMNLLKLKREVFIVVILIFLYFTFFSSESPWIEYEEGDQYPVFQIKPGDHLMLIEDVSQELLLERHFCEAGEIEAHIGGQDTLYRIFENGIIFVSERKFSGIVVFVFPDGSKMKLQLQQDRKVTAFLRNKPSENCGLISTP